MQHEKPKAELFLDPCNGDWRKNWMLDGDDASVVNTPDGMVFKTSETHHAVLWTREEFTGDLRIEYDFTRLDSYFSTGVNILYIQARGMGVAPYVEDIARWSHLRRDPRMDLYFNFMKTLHISYAAYYPDGRFEDDYIRARRYLPKGDVPNGLDGTAVMPDDYAHTGLFAPGETSHITVEKNDRTLSFEVKTAEREERYVWDLTPFPPLQTGRIGLRLMANRESRFADFRITRP